MQQHHVAPPANRWWQGRMCAFDTETTGTDPTQARLVTATVSLVGGGKETATQSWLCIPEAPIPAEATAVHGITTEYAEAHGRPVYSVASEIALALVMAICEGWPLVIFNAPYDLTLILNELERVGAGRHSALPQRLADSALIVDPLVIDRGLDKFRKGSRKLADMCAHYGITLENAHDASADALAAARLVYRMGAKFGAPMADLVGLQHQQRTWYKAWCLNFADYLRREGKPTDDLHPDGWPFRAPVREEAVA